MNQSMRFIEIKYLRVFNIFFLDVDSTSNLSLFSYIFFFSNLFSSSYTFLFSPNSSNNSLLNFENERKSSAYVIFIEFKAVWPNLQDLKRTNFDLLFYVKVNSRFYFIYCSLYNITKFLCIPKRKSVLRKKSKGTGSSIHLIFYLIFLFYG